MPVFEFSDRLPHPPAVVFDFFRRPANVVAVAPDWLQLKLLEAPPVVEVGALIRVQTRRWGIARVIVTEVTALEVGRRIVEEQREGPFRAWEHVREFIACDEGCEVRERIDVQTPGGMLGLILTPASVQRELERAYGERRPRLLAALAQSASDRSA